jgi:hypothetical protein
MVDNQHFVFFSVFSGFLKVCFKRLEAYLQQSRNISLGRQNVSSAGAGGMLQGS